MMAMGEWWLRSEKDPRFNSHGTGMVGMFGCPPDATERIRELERELECKAPDDLEVEYMKYRGERMRFIEIDGEKREVRCCEDCPCYDGGFDAGFGDMCKHPRGDGSVAARGGSAWYDEDKHEHRFDDDVPEEYRYGYGCPLRSDDLLPCPFCGGEAEKFTSTSKGHPKECVRCKECGISTGWFFGTGNDKNLAKIWNRRQRWH